MRIKHFAISGLIFLSIQSLNLSVSDKAEAFTSFEGGFSIWMPGEPTLQQVNHKSFVGNVKETSYVLKTESEKYSSSYAELPGIALSFLSDNALLNKAKKNFLKATRAQETSFQKIIFEGKGGRELVFQIPSENKSNMIGKARFYVFGKKLYVVTITANEGPVRNELMDRYLNSFRFLSTPEKELSLNLLRKE